MLIMPILLYRVIALIVYLENQGVNCRIIKFFRKRKTAHRWSTAYQIFDGNISIGVLRSLQDGMDIDGNVWYRPEWDPGYDDYVSGNTSELIKRNAITLGPPKIVYAEEGYDPDDPHRLPNLKDIPVSKHVYGLAIDAFIEWSKLEGPCSDTAKGIVAKFGLVRPVDNESWHIEVDSEKLFAISPYLIVSPHRVFVWLINRIANRFRANKQLA
jgi:hypothetical protein